MSFFIKTLLCYYNLNYYKSIIDISIYQITMIINLKYNIGINDVNSIKMHSKKNS